MLEIEGLEETEGGVQEFALTIEELERQVAKLNDTFGGVGTALEAFGSRVDAATASFVKAVKATPTEEELARREQEKQAQDAEQLRRKMAGMIGGGMNFAAYEQNLKKVEDQMNAIRDAEAKHLVTFREGLEAKAKLGIQWAKLAVEAKAYEAAGGGALGRVAGMVANRLVNAPGMLAGAAKNQVAGIGTGVMGLINSTPLGHAAGGLFGLMLHGEMNRDRLAAEAGEVANIVVAAGGKSTSAATRFFAGFQEQAEHYFGMSRQEVQGALKTFVEAGVGLEDIMQKQSDALGDAGKNIVTLTLAVDKHFEMASGTSARTVSSMMSDYGMEVSKAGDIYTRLAFAGQQSGMGTQNFMNTVMQASGSLRPFGVSIETMGGALEKLQQRYEALGMPKQLAGTLAGQGMSQMAGGLAGMNATMQSYIGERMGLGQGLDARMNFRDGMQRLSQGGDAKYSQDMIREVYKAAMEAGQGDKTQARYFLEQQGFGFEGSKAIVEMGDEIDKGLDLSKLSVEKQKALSDAFKTEGQRQSEMQKNQYTIMQGMAEVGQGLLQIVTNLVAYGIVFFKGMPMLLMGTEQEKRDTLKMMDEFTRGMATGAKRIFGGAQGVAKGAYSLMKPIIGPLENALSWNPYTTNMSTDQVRIVQAGKSVEQQLAQENSATYKLGSALREKGDKAQQAGDAKGGAYDDAGILLQGLGTALGRLTGQIAKAAGGEDDVAHARKVAESLAKQEIEREKQDSEAKAKVRQAFEEEAKKKNPVKITGVVTVKPATGSARPHTR